MANSAPLPDIGQYSTTESILRNLGGLEANCLRPPRSRDDDDNNVPHLYQNSYYYDTELMTEVLHIKKDVFNILSLNCQSINAKINNIKLFLESVSSDINAFDAICLQETWLSADSPTDLVKLDGYNMINQGKSCSHHGGLIIYVKSCYQYNISCSVKDSAIWEGLFIEIKGNILNKPLIIGNIYRPPKNLNSNYESFINEFSNTISKFTDVNKECVIAGDYNIDLLKTSERPIFGDYLDTVLALGFIPKISFPTRFTSNNNATLIDNFLCKLSNNYSACTPGILTTLISDHQPYFICLDFMKKRPEPNQLITITTKSDDFYEKVNNELSLADITNKLNSNPNHDPNDSYETFESILIECIRKHVITKKVKFRKHKHKKSEWITSGILKSIKYRDKLYMKIKQTSPESNDFVNLKTNLRTYNNILKKSIRAAKIDYYNKKFSNAQNNIKQTWKHINGILNKSSKESHLPDHINQCNSTIQGDREILEAFNKHFANVGKTLSNSLGDINDEISHRIYLNEHSAPNFEFEPISPEKVSNLIDGLTSKSTSADDGISTILLKRIKATISKPIALIINQTFATSKFPNKLKTARVKALFKKNDLHDMNNYRPISVLPSISKIFEKALLNQLNDHFQMNNFYHHGQYGFREKHSTELATLELIDRITKDIDNGQVPIAIFLDLSKAFDSLNHSILLEKLKYYGIVGRALELCANYLSNRHQYVQHEELKSDMTLIDTGVPQGSVLGPFLFLVYINDFIKCSDLFKMVNYADDTTLLTTLNASVNTNEGLSINRELSNIHRWLTANKLCLNASKTKFMVFHTPQRRITLPNLTINGSSIECVDNFNYLGIFIDTTLSWKTHMAHVRKKIGHVNCILHKLKQFLPKHILKTIYNSLISCHLNYGSLAWGHKGHQLIKTQKKAIRAITNSKYNAHTEPLFKKLKIPKIEDMIKLAEMKFYYKHLKGSLPSYFLGDYIQSNQDFHNYHTRNRGSICTPTVHYELSKSSLRFRIVSTINNCPNIVKTKLNTHSLSGFTKYFKNFMINQYNETCLIPSCYICERQSI